MAENPAAASGDRRVHARLITGAEIVRYDRAGHWYIEPIKEKRSHITIADAVALVMTPQAEVFYGLPGGTMFDAKVRKAMEDADA